MLLVAFLSKKPFMEVSQLNARLLIMKNCSDWELAYLLWEVEIEELKPERDRAKSNRWIASQKSKILKEMRKRGIK